MGVTERPVVGDKEGRDGIADGDEDGRDGRTDEGGEEGVTVGPADVSTDGRGDGITVGRTVG